MLRLATSDHGLARCSLCMNARVDGTLAREQTCPPSKISVPCWHRLRVHVHAAGQTSWKSSPALRDWNTRGVVPRPDYPCEAICLCMATMGPNTQYHCIFYMPCMHRNLAMRTELGLVDMYSHASVQLMHFHGYVHVSALACLYTFRPRQHHYVPSQPFGIWPPL